ncbi:MAG TPA: 50S ribosomal protein L18 [bacterium]|jgi:large subunit ribosomal protein L18|nr:50S ribosomal protein L18 [bacterium]HOG38074.1 50S ribosomal protein L18 [bacterium]HQI03130.1 50S ribosomal protein L18 [bacterium]
MDKNKKIDLLKLKRHKRVRAIIKGDAKRPRLSVRFSLNHSYIQLIDDEKGVTIVSATDKELKSKGKNTKIAEELGKLIAEKALAKKITKVVFDRGSKKYHGKVKALADSARSNGLEF